MWTNETFIIVNTKLNNNDTSKQLKYASIFSKELKQ